MPPKRKQGSMLSDAETNASDATQNPVHTAKRRAGTLTAFGSTRYPGHDTSDNKDALLDVIIHRKENLKRPLSVPEETAYRNSKRQKMSITGKGNTTNEMPSGTAICHKVSDKAIRNKINGLLKGPDHILRAYLEEGIRYITPDHNKHQTPASGAYEKEAQAKVDTANTALTSFNESTFKKAEFAHQVGRAIANSPVNLFIGDSRRNSSNQQNFDTNINFASLTNKSESPLTPRSTEANKWSYKQHRDSRGGSSSSVPKFAKGLSASLRNLARGASTDQLWRKWD